MTQIDRRLGLLAIGLLAFAAFINPLALRGLGLLLYTQPVPKSGFWLLAILSGGSGAMLLAALRFRPLRLPAMAWISTALAILVVEAAMRFRPPVEVTGASRIPKVTFNSIGTWDAEPRRDAKLRVLVLGDSVTHGVGDFLDNTCRYHDLLEKQLVAEGLDIDVQSVAESGWSLQRYMFEYDRLAPRYDPNIVLVGWCMNDINYGAAAAQVEGNAEGGNRPQAQSLRWRLGQMARAVRLNESFLCTLALKRGSLLLKRAGLAAADWIDEHQTTYFQRMSDWWNDERLVQQVRCDLQRLKDDCGSHHRQLLIAIFPYSFQVDGDGSAVLKFRQLLGDLKVDFVDMTEIFRADGSKDLYSYRDEAHPNRKGHEVAFRALLPAVRRAIARLTAAR